MAATAKFREEVDKPGIGERVSDFGRGLKGRFSTGGPKGPWWKLRISTIIALSVLVLGIAGRVYDLEMVELVRVKTFDLYQRIEPRQRQLTEDGINILPVGIVDLDEKSLHEIGQWPWPRTVIADLLNSLADGGAAGVAFDIVFPEYDRTSPDQIADSIRGADETTVAKLKALPRSEDVLAQAMKRIRTVVGQVGLNTPLPDGKAPPSNKSSIRGVKSKVALKGVKGSTGYPYPFINSYTAFMGNVPELEKAAAGHGIFSVSEEHDGIVRRVPLISRVDKEVRPALTVELLRAALGSRNILVERDAAGVSAILLQVPGENFKIPTDAQGRIYVHFSRADPFNTKDNKGRLYVSASDIIKGRVPKRKTAGRFFIVGTSAVGLLDIRATPIQGRLPGVEVHANILEQIFAATNARHAKASEILKTAQADAAKTGMDTKSREFAELVGTQLAEIEHEDFYLKYPPIANSIESAMILFAGLFMMIFIPRMGPKFTLGGIIVAGGFLVSLSWHLYTEELILLDVAYPGVVTIALYSVLTFANYMREAQEKKQVRGAFGQYLSPALVEQLAADPDRLQLGGETKEMTFLFCDVRGFTAISETFKSNPQGLTVLINRLLTPRTNVIMARQGTIDKYMGDCIMAFWNAPLDDDKHAVNGCESALEMFKALDILNEERRLEAEEEGVPFLPLNVGAGLNTGDCVVGNMGSEQRFDYSVLGDPVNLAARLESQSKNYGVKIVIGPKTAEAGRDRFAMIEIDKIQVKGQSVGVDIYALLGDSDMAAEPDFIAHKEKHDAMIEAYRTQHWDDAESLLGECRRMTGDTYDVLYDLYQERIEYYQEVPPPVDWDGVYIAETK